MDSNWWVLRGLLSRRVMRLGRGLVGLAVVYVLFFGPLADWTQETILNRATAIGEERADRLKDALNLPSVAPTVTVRLSIPRRDGRASVRRLRAAGYDVSVRAREGTLWQVAVSDLSPAGAANVERLLRQVSPKARRLHDGVPNTPVN